MNVASRLRLSFILMHSLARLASYNPRYSNDSASILADCPPVN
jgi:hypothetical protein